MIKGIGTDLVKQSRVESIYKKYNRRFLSKILSKRELSNFYKEKSERVKLNYICSSFAAKEAYVKALGTGFRGIYPNQLTYHKDSFGKPTLECECSVNYNIHLSISNTDGYTLSFIVLEE